MDPLAATDDYTGAEKPAMNGVRTKPPGSRFNGAWKLFQRDSMLALERRILESDADPNSRIRFISEEEIRRVIATNPDEIIPALVLERLARFARNEIRRPRGRPSRRDNPVHSVFDDAVEDIARTYYEDVRDRLASSSALLTRARRWFGLGEEFATCAECAAELTRRKYYHHMATSRAVMNRMYRRRGF